MTKGVFITNLQRRYLPRGTNGKLARFYQQTCEEMAYYPSSLLFADGSTLLANVVERTLATD